MARPMKNWSDDPGGVDVNLEDNGDHRRQSPFWFSVQSLSLNSEPNSCDVLLWIFQASSPSLRTRCSVRFVLVVLSYHCFFRIICSRWKKYSYPLQDSPPWLLLQQGWGEEDEKKKRSWESHGWAETGLLRASTVLSMGGILYLRVILCSTDKMDICI